MPPDTRADSNFTSKDERQPDEHTATLQQAMQALDIRSAGSDHINVPPTSLLNLPEELFSQIVLALPVSDILRTQTVCSKLNSIIAGSVEIQYHIALEVTGFKDNPACSSLSTSERFERLLQGQKAWHELKPQFATTGITSPKPLSGGYHDLRGGVFAPGSDPMSGVDYVMLPEKEGEGVEWKSVDLKEVCFDAGSCWAEHDLIVVLTIGWLDDATSLEIALHIRQLSTGQPHPEAKQPRIIACESRSGPSGFNINVVGDNLAVRLKSSEHSNIPLHDRLLVFEWRTGLIKASLVAPPNSYTDSAFLEENLLLLANARRGALEIWDIPRVASGPSPSAPVCVLKLPLLAHGRSYRSIRCHSEPNPEGANRRPGMTGDQTSRRQRRPCRNNPEEAIISFDVFVEAPRRSYSFFVHRKSVLQIVQDYRQGQGSPTLADISSGSGPLPPPIPWKQWGEKITMWIETTDVVSNGSTYRTAGQRTVLMPNKRWDSAKASIVVLDFNPWSIKKCRYALAEREHEFQQKMKNTPIRPQHEDQFLDRPEEGVQRREEPEDSNTVVQQDRHERPALPLGVRFSDAPGLGASPLGHAEPVKSPKIPPDFQSEILQGGLVTEVGENGEGQPKYQLSGLQGRTRGSTWTLSESSTVDLAGDCFWYPVKSELPCIRYDSDEVFDYNAILMDEERVLGMKANNLGGKGEFDVLYFG